MRRYYLQLPNSEPVPIDPEDLWNARGDVRAFAADIAYHLTRKSAEYNGGCVRIFDEHGKLAVFVPIMPFEHEIVAGRTPSPISGALH